PRGSVVGFCLPAYRKSNEDRGIPDKGISSSGIWGPKIPWNGSPHALPRSMPVEFPIRPIEKPYDAIQYYNVRFHGRTLLMQYICTLARSWTKTIKLNSMKR